MTDEDVGEPIVLVLEWRDLEGNDSESILNTIWYLQLEFVLNLWVILQFNLIVASCICIQSVSQISIQFDICYLNLYSIFDCSLNRTFVSGSEHIFLTETGGKTLSEIKTKSQSLRVIIALICHLKQDSYKTQFWRVQNKLAKLSEQSREGREVCKL